MKFTTVFSRAKEARDRVVAREKILRRIGWGTIEIMEFLYWRQPELRVPAKHGVQPGRARFLCADADEVQRSPTAGGDMQARFWERRVFEHSEDRALKLDLNVFGGEQSFCGAETGKIETPHKLLARGMQEGEVTTLKKSSPAVSPAIKTQAGRFASNLR